MVSTYSSIFNKSSVVVVSAYSSIFNKRFVVVVYTNASIFNKSIKSSIVVDITHG